MSPDLAGAGSCELSGSAVPGALRRSEFRAMGTSVCVLTGAAANGAAAAHATAAAHGAAADQVERLFAGWEDRLSRFRPDSELSRLNARSGRPVVVSDLLLEVVSAALRAARATSGLYDPTLLRAIEQLGYDRSFERIGQTAPPLAGPIASVGVGPGADFLASKRLAGLFTIPSGERRPAGSWPTGTLEDRSASAEEARWSPASP